MDRRAIRIGACDHEPLPARAKLQEGRHIQFDAAQRGGDVDGEVVVSPTRMTNGCSQVRREDSKDVCRAADILRARVEDGTVPSPAPAGKIS
jgi:hypothetical protein